MEAYRTLGVILCLTMIWEGRKKGCNYERDVRIKGGDENHLRLLSYFSFPGEKQLTALKEDFARPK
jgi:hypothetical protein